MELEEKDSNLKNNKEARISGKNDSDAAKWHAGE